MAYREFLDDDGRSWRAWETYPQKPQVVAPGFEDGWLSFETDGEKWRLVPVPPAWFEATESRLRELLRLARRRALGSPHPPR